MTVETTTARVTYTGAGTTGPFSVPFYFLEDDDLTVIKTTIADGTETTLALTTDYTVSGAADEAGGSVTLTASLSSDYKLTIIRDPDLLQEADYPPNDKFPAATHERVVDKLTMIVQRLYDLVNRAIRLPDGDVSGTAVQIPSVANRAGKYLGFAAVTGELTPMSGTVAETDAAIVSYTPAGSGAVERNARDKLRESVSVKDFGAVGDGVTDDTAAINAAIAASNRVYFPAGLYKVTSTITITKAISLYGDGPSVSYLRSTSTTLDLLHIKCATTAQYDYLGGVSIKDLGISRNVAATAGANLRMTQLSGAFMSNVSIVGGFNGLKIQGSQLSKICNLAVSANTVSLVAGSSCIQIEETPTDGATYQPAYTHQFSNLIIAGGGKSDYCINITSGDGVSFNNGYINDAAVSNIRLAAATSGQYISPVTFVNIYSDSAAPNGLRYESTVGSGYVRLESCFFNGNTSDAIYIAAPAVSLSFYMHNTHVGFTPAWGAYVSGGGTPYTRVMVENCRFMSVGTGASKGGIYATNCRTLKLSGNDFTDINGAGSAAISLAGNIATYQSVGNLHSGNTSDFSSSATITTPLYGGSSNDFGTFSTSVSIAFGGASTGITYSGRAASWSRVGRHVVFNIYIALSSKGSSTGVVTIEGLPFASNSSNVSTLAVNFGSGVAGVGDTALSATISGGVTNIKVNKTSAGLPVQLTDADFTNTSYISVSGSYYV